MCAFGKISFFDISRPELEAVKDTYFEDQISSFFLSILNFHFIIELQYMRHEQSLVKLSS